MALKLTVGRVLGLAVGSSIFTVDTTCLKLTKPTDKSKDAKCGGQSHLKNAKQKKNHLIKDGSLG